MPLKARLLGRPIISIALPRDLDWEQVREASRRGEITMSCCGVPGTAKQNQSGTRFFAHRPGAPFCAWESESAEHLQLKAVACQAAIEAGAEADTEVRSSPEGMPEWIADVLATHAGARRVIEIQLSPQTLAETRYRTARYRREGIEVLWFFRTKPEGMTIDEKVPAVVLPEHPEEAEHIVRERSAAFAVGALVWNNGNRTAPITLVGYEAQCRNCGEVYHHTPYALLRLMETNGRDLVAAQDVKRLNIRGIGPWPHSWRLSSAPPQSPDPLGRRLGGQQSSCPHCKVSAPECPMPVQDAFLWPHNQVDGEASWYEPSGWVPAPAPPRPYRARADELQWRAVLERHGLILDPRTTAETFSARRRDYDERVRRQKEAEEARRRELEERDAARRRWALRIIQDLKGEERSRVCVEVFYSLPSIHSIKVQFPFDEAGKSALKRQGARWDPKDRSWTVAISYGQDYQAEVVRDIVLDLRRRLDRRRLT